MSSYLDAPHPIDYPPQTWEGWSGPNPQIIRVIATVHWSNGRATEHRVFAHQWTKHRVRVCIETDHDPRRRTAMLWLPATDVRRNSERPRVGETIPAPWRGPSWLVVATQEDVDAWPELPANRRP